MFPVERCTIYDAGSRAFEVRAYLEDVLEYWEAVEALENVSFGDYLRERCPALDASKLQVGSLRALARQQCERLRRALPV